MIPLDEAQAHVRSRCPSPVVESVPLAGALGLVLAEDVVSAEDVPPFANTAMDGFAVRAGDTAGAPVCLAVVGTVAAGAAPDVAVGEGEAVRIMTGAPMPPGADAVVMVERTRVLDDGAGEQVEVEVEVPVGNHVRQAGEDLLAGQVVLAAGIPLVPGRIGVLASVNRSEVRAFRRPRVGVVSTGDELVADGSSLAPGQIRDSNRPGLLALVAESGFTPVDLGLVPDREDAIEAVLRDGVAVFGLPGNPVSSMVSFELFARPALRAMAGHADVERRRIRAVAATAMPRRPDGKTHFARVVLDEFDGAVRVSSSGGQGSHQLTAMAGADGLAVLPDGDGVAAGDQVEVLLLR